MANMFAVPETPRVGDVVMVKQGIGVVRYVGNVEFDKGKYFGIEVKGPPVIGGHNGSYGQTQYFQTSKPQRGIFCKQVIRLASCQNCLFFPFFLFILCSFFFFFLVLFWIFCVF